MLISKYIISMVFLFCFIQLRAQLNDSVTILHKENKMSKFSKSLDSVRSGNMFLFPISSMDEYLPKNTLNSSTWKSSLNQNLERQLQAFKTPLNFKKPFLDIRDLSIAINSDYPSNPEILKSNYVQQTNSIHTDLALWNLPFSVNYNTHQSDFINQMGFGSAIFDKEKFMHDIKDRIKQVANPESIFEGALSQLYEKRDQAFNSLKNDLVEVVKNQEKVFSEGIIQKINLENISGQGVEQFLNNIINENLTDISLKEKVISQIRSKNEFNSLDADSIALLNREIEGILDSKSQMENEIGVLKEKWFKNGILKTIGSFEKEKQSTINKLMDDPSAIAKIASEKLKLPFLQKMLLNAKSLNIGSSGLDQGTMGLNDALLKGVNLEYFKGNQFFAPVLGVIPGIKNVTDLNYSNFSELPDIRTSALRLGKGDLKNDFSHISVSLFQPINNNSQPLLTGYQSTLPKNLVTTFSKRMSIGNSQTLLTEFSKSTMMYNAPSGVKENGLKDVMNSDNFFGNMGFNLDYGIDDNKSGITNRILVRYTGKEYNNLGDYSLASGSKEVSNDLKKSFLKRKLIINVKARYREYEFSADGRKWKSISYTTDAKWKFKKGEFIQVRYQPYFNRRVSQKESYITSKSYRVALRGNINRKVMKGFTYRNFLELTSSNDSFYDLIQDKFISNGFISFTSLQTLNIGQQTLFFNTIVNHSRKNTEYLYGNSSLALDGGMTFNPKRNISMSSALAYNGVNKMYGQLSLRQSLSAALGKKIVLDGYINAGKNVYKLPGLHIPAVTGNLSITYQLK